MQRVQQSIGTYVSKTLDEAKAYIDDLVERRAEVIFSGGGRVSFSPEWSPLSHGPVVIISVSVSGLNSVAYSLARTTLGDTRSLAARTLAHA